MRAIRGDSTEYLKINLTSPDDITTDLVEVSLDSGVTWHAAEHVTGGVRILIGPAGVASLPAGRWDVRVRITDSPEIPVISAGTLAVTA